MPIHLLKAKSLDGEVADRSKGNRKLADGAGLYLHIRRAGQASWAYQFRFSGATHWLGIGPYATFTLDEARERHHELRRLRDRGIDPRSGVAANALAPYRLPAPAAMASAAPAVASAGPIFSEVVEMFLAAFAPGWSGGADGKEAGAYRRTLLGHDLASVPITDVALVHVEEALKRYSDAPVTAEKTLIRIAKVIGFATAKGLRPQDLPNPAQIKGLWEFLARPVVPQTNHLAALPWKELPMLMGELVALGTTEARALIFTILTAARSDETLGATWSEIDVANKLWNIPGERMKEGIGHSIPLAPAVLKLLGKPGKPGEFVFGSRRHGTRKPMWTHSMLGVLKSLRPNYTVHGFRSSFRDWSAEAGYPHDLGERALAHATGTKVSSAYQRSKLIEQRRPMMLAWSKFAGLR